MKAVIQRVTQSTVTVNEEIVGGISLGLMVLLGVARDDTSRDSRYLAEKIVNLRIFEDNQGKMNRSLLDVRGAMLVVSQFTLLGDCRKGRRPSFISAAPPEEAEALYLDFCGHVRDHGIEVSKGQFGAMMQVSLINNGPVTLILESKFE
jgi:D-tyrosyl-tRNA(Tyr) deacylase